MRRVRFEKDNRVYDGQLYDDRVRPLGEREDSQYYALDDVRLLAPAVPTKVLAIGLNYLDHAEEMGLDLPTEPLLFLKPPSAVIGPNDTIILPPQSSRVDYEAELAIVIGKETRNISSEVAAQYILGYTCLNDVTERDLQKKDGQWTRAKGFNTFCPIGPWIDTDLDPRDLKIELSLNGELKQKSRTSQLVFDPFQLVEFISHIMTLFPGDVIATGTTSGIGPMNHGDVVEVRIEELGALINPVAGAKS